MTFSLLKTIAITSILTYIYLFIVIIIIKKNDLSLFPFLWELKLHIYLYLFHGLKTLENVDLKPKLVLVEESEISQIGSVKVIVLPSKTAVDGEQENGVFLLVEWLVVKEPMDLRSLCSVDLIEFDWLILVFCTRYHHTV